MCFNSLQPEHILVIMLIIYELCECVMQIHIVGSCKLFFYESEQCRTIL